MAEKPILFSGEMVRAILSGRKTQTRRVVKPQLEPAGGSGWDGIRYFGSVDKWCLSKSCSSGAFVRATEVKPEYPYLRCPYGKPGDRLWVRETWQPVLVDGDCDWDCSLRDGRNLRVNYRATDAGEECGEYLDDIKVRWRPSIHMPRWASRLTLTVKNVRVERLNEISEADALAEGIEPWATERKLNPYWTTAFSRLWDSINADRGYDWASNPWVWVVEFEPAAPAAGQEDEK